MVAAVLGASSVVLTDMEEALDPPRASVARNRATWEKPIASGDDSGPIVSVESLMWGEDALPTSIVGPTHDGVDVVIAADVLGATADGMVEGEHHGPYFVQLWPHRRPPCVRYDHHQCVLATCRDLAGPGPFGLFLATLRLFAALKQPHGPPRFLLAYKRRLRYRELPFFEWLSDEFRLLVWMVEGGSGYVEPEDDEPTAGVSVARAQQSKHQQLTGHYVVELMPK